MVDITISKDETVELDTLIKESGLASDPVNYDDSGTSLSDKFNVSGIQTHTTILDPKEVGTHEININGQIVKIEVIDQNSLPYRNKLHSRYDATQLSLNDGESVSTWDDVTGNGYDLTAGNEPTYRTDKLNSNAVVEFKSKNTEYLNESSTLLSQPNSIFIVANQESNSRGQIFGSNDSSNRETFQWNSDTNNWEMFSNDAVVSGGSNNGDFYIFSVIYDENNSFSRKNGTQIMSGDPGSNGLGGITLGKQPGGSDAMSGNIAEILIYPDRRSNKQIQNIETYLSDKWGVSIN